MTVGMAEHVWCRLSQDVVVMCYALTGVACLCLRIVLKRV